MSVIGMDNDARGWGEGGIKKLFPEHCKPNAHVQSNETKRVKGLCN